MAFRRILVKREFKTLIESPPRQTSPIPPSAAKSNFHRELLTSPESLDSDEVAGGFFRRFFHRRAMLPELLSLPVGDRLREKLMAAGCRIRLDGLSPPPNSPSPAMDVGGFGGISAVEAKKILRSAQMEKLRCALRGIDKSSITYSEYVRVCTEVCSNREQGEECAKMLDESGHVIVLGNVVFLRPDQVARSMEKLISESIAIPNDPRRRELEHLEKEKAFIDRKARQQVRAELYCGLGFLTLQTLGFMRLTFWELSWDVMEPICFFATSLHFAIAYGFFLRTSKEPTFEGFFERRFKAKQKKLMEIHGFDLEKYDSLCKAFYPNHGGFGGNGHFSGPEFAKVMH